MCGSTTALDSSTDACSCVGPKAPANDCRAYPFWSSLIGSSTIRNPSVRSRVQYSTHPARGKDTELSLHASTQAGRVGTPPRRRHPVRCAVCGVPPNMTFVFRLFCCFVGGFACLVPVAPRGNPSVVLTLPPLFALAFSLPPCVLACPFFSLPFPCLLFYRRSRTTGSS